MPRQRRQGATAKVAEQRNTVSSEKAHHPHAAVASLGLVGVASVVAAVVRFWPGSDSARGVMKPDAALAEAKKLLQSDADAAVMTLEHALQASSLEDSMRIRLLEEMASAHSQMKRHDSALKYRTEVLATQRRMGLSNADLAITHATIASDCLLNFHLEDALSHVRKAQAFTGLPPEALAVLLRQEAAIHECADDFISALHRFEHASKLAPSKSAEHAIKHLELLRYTVISSGSRMPEQVRTAMQARAKSIATQLVSHGQWEHTDQLPRNFLPGLLAKPWHSLEQPNSDAQWAAWLLPAAELLTTSTLALLEEYKELRRAGLMRRETECIHGHGKGEWRRFEVTGAWEKLKDGCATAAPVACALFGRLRALGMPLIRAGYSAVQPRGWLKPHFGMTNGQLKWHLGLQVPQGGCAILRVANVSRAWQEGSLLFFDDSFEHEVWNRCNAERVVFQVVFVHPDLKDSPWEPNAKFAIPKVASEH